MNLVYEQIEGLGIDSCVQCGTPLLGMEGIKAFISGMQERFCRGQCAGEYRQQQSIAYK